MGTFLRSQNIADETYNLTDNNASASAPVEIHAGVYDLEIRGVLDGAACSIQSQHGENWFPLAPGGRESIVAHSLPHLAPRLRILEDCTVRLAVAVENRRQQGPISITATLAKR
jgi:hypothetical protein